MRVELQIDANCEEPFAVLHISKLTPSIQEAIKILEDEGIQNIITAQSAGKVFLIDPQTIEVIRTEGRELVLYNKSKERYLLSKPLYELERLLGNDFIRISKSAIISLRCIHHAEASFNGTMEVVKKNGIEEVITRSYKKQFKERLGV